MILYAKIAAVYLILCMILGFLGRRRKMGAWGYFFGSIVLTPLIGLLLLLASDPLPKQLPAPSPGETNAS